MNDAQRLWVCAQCDEMEDDESVDEPGETLGPAARNSDLEKACSLVYQNDSGVYVCRCTSKGKTLH